MDDTLLLISDSQVDNIDICCRDYMDRFLDEQESPATLDRVTLPAVSVTDCEQQQVLGFPTDASSCQIHVHGEPVTVVRADGDDKPCLSNGESLTVAASDKVKILSKSESLVDNDAASEMPDSIFIKVETDTDTAKATVHSQDSRINIADNSSDAFKPTSVLHFSCHEAPSELLGNSQVEKMETDTVDSDAAAAATAVLKEKPITGDDVTGDDVVISVPPEVVASSSVTTASIAVCNQQDFADGKASSSKHEASNHCTSTSVSLGTELPINTVPQGSQANICSVQAADADVVKPADVELLLAAVDSATSMVGSSYSSVDPLTAVLEISSSTTVSAELLPNGADTVDSACQLASSNANSSKQSSSQETNSLPCESTLLMHSSDSPLLPLSSSSNMSSPFTSGLLPNSADVLTQDDGSIAPKSTTHDHAGRDVEMLMDEPSVAVITTSTSDLLAANTDMSPGESNAGDMPLIAVLASEGDDTIEMGKDTQCRNKNEFASLNSNQSAESCLQSNNIATSISGPDPGNMHTDSTDTVSVETNSDVVQCSFASGDVVLSDRLVDQPHSLDEAGESTENADSRSLLVVASASSAS